LTGDAASGMMGENMKGAPVRSSKKAKGGAHVNGGWRNRIVGHGEEEAEQLLANPKNWRIHPKAQQDALEGVLKTVGWVQNVIVNQRTGFVVDGHARVAMAITAGEKVPVVYVDLSEEEEALILATLDPLAAMAATDEELYRSLVADIPPEMAVSVQDLLNGTAANFLPASEQEQGRLDQIKPVKCPECGCEFSPS